MFFLFTILPSFPRLIARLQSFYRHRRIAARRRVSCGTPFRAEERELRKLLDQFDAIRPRDRKP